MKQTLIILITLFSIGISSNDELHSDIKSMSWKKINRNLSSKTTITKLEAFALSRVLEETEKKKSNSANFWYSIVTGKYPETITSKEIRFLVEGSHSLEFPLSKVSFWKLYNYLVKQKKLNKKERITLLEKLGTKEDPIANKGFEELLSILVSEGEFSTVLAKIDSVREEDKFFQYSPLVKYYKILASYKETNDKEKSISSYYQLLGNDIESELGVKIIAQLQKLKGDDFYLQLTGSELALVCNLLSKKEQKKISPESVLKTYSNSLELNKASRFLLRHKPSMLLKLVKINSSLVTKNHKLLANLAEGMFYNNDLSDAETILDEFGSDSNEAEVYKQKSRIYKKWDKKEKYFQNLVKYLSIYPYDMIFQDKLIDFLAESNSNSVAYADEKYWNLAMNQIPNLPVKGRLVYWYLRFLKFTNKKERLNEILAIYYSLCSGSYYTSVIANEFQAEIATLSIPQNPYSSKESLFRYLSLKLSPEVMASLATQNVSFAYFKDSKELGQRLNAASNTVGASSTLMLAVEYLKLGEMKLAMSLAESYFEKMKLGERERHEVLVGLGDMSKTTYLSLFHTRTLMKLLKIPDDPILLPSEIHTRLYPRPHRELVVKSTKEFDVEEEVVYAIMRQESFFRENAISSSNARGLMQVMPSTGKFLARKLSTSNYSLHDPEVSIRFGAKFLADLLSNYDNKLTWASIAYNGGPGNLRKWKRNHYKNDFNHFLEELPSKESRDYCRVIMSNYMNYKFLTKLQGY
ncbi:MAG: lytic transglycosylase domain-containing protein [Leptospiraceae bacterium]|nr:lytic transglycosylase domain-containing protein [Leptospiraceae bacterium]